MVVWNEIESEFAFDGAWLDVCVFDTTIDDWQHAVDVLERDGFRMGFWSTEGEPAELPRSISEAFGRDEKLSGFLAVTAGAVSFRCHFFQDDEIEFDFDPREVVGQTELDAVLRFMAALARASDKPAWVSPENLHGMPFLRVDPSGTATYVRATGGPK